MRNKPERRAGKDAPREPGTSDLNIEVHGDTEVVHLDGRVGERASRLRSQMSKCHAGRAMGTNFDLDAPAGERKKLPHVNSESAMGLRVSLEERERQKLTSGNRYHRTAARLGL
jgi:hypothetical protein